MFRHFGLTLMVNHACNLRCTYCYTGTKFSRPMPESIGRCAIDRANASLVAGGTLELGFFGGEPLVEPDLIESLIDHARFNRGDPSNKLLLQLTTNGTLSRGAAWRVMLRPDLDIALSHDGLPEVHDRHRRTADGHPTSTIVEQTIERLLDAGKVFRVVMVVRPDNLEDLACGMEHLKSLGVSAVDPSLDLWATWTEDDVNRLERAIALCARFWRESLPNFGISWFDEKAAALADVDFGETARCGFGHGEVAVAPSGRLYPCERLIGDDADDNPMRLPGAVVGGADFIGMAMPPAITPGSAPAAAACEPCAMRSMCNTICRCSNFVRTGNVRIPDGLLCRWNQACAMETARVLSETLIQ